MLSALWWLDRLRLSQCTGRPGMAAHAPCPAPAALCSRQPRTIKHEATTAYQSGVQAHRYARSARGTKLWLKEAGEGAGEEHGPDLLWR